MKFRINLKTINVQLGIGERIAIIMKEKGFEKQNLFAAHCNIATNTLSRVLKGHGNPDFEFVSKIAVAFPDINARWLLSGEGEIYLNYKYSAEAPSMAGEMPAMYTSTIPSLVAQNTKLIDQVTENLKIQKINAETQAEMAKAQSSMAETQRLNAETILNLSRSEAKEKKAQPSNTT